jgi:hypothetical protein
MVALEQKELQTFHAAINGVCSGREYDVPELESFPKAESTKNVTSHAPHAPAIKKRSQDRLLIFLLNYLLMEPQLTARSVSGK